MDDAATRATAIAAARSLLLREGDKFTLASLCKESGLNRARLRRAFPTKATLITAALDELRAESARGQSGMDSAAASNHENDVGADGSRTVPATTSDNLDTSTNANNSEPARTPIEDNWIERRFHVMERAIAALEAQVETRCGEQSNSIALLEQKLTSVTNAPIVHAAIVEPPPLIGEQEQLEPNIEADLIHDFDIALNTSPSMESITQPNEDAPSGHSPSRVRMLAILENAQRSGDGIPAEGRIFENPRMGLFAVTAAIFASLLIIAGLFWAHDRARATEAPAEAAQQHAQVPASVALIDATGIPKLHSNEVAPGASGLIAPANGRNVLAQTVLAEAYLRGTGVERDSLAAARWSLVAAEQGEPSAQFILGTLYSEGIKPDPRLAVKWFLAAASRGNVKAMHNLGVAFLNGQGVARDPATAASWFSRAANLGYRDSAFDLAVLYERGEGVSQNPQEALIWYDKASSAGDQEAAQRASFLRSNIFYVGQK